MYKCGGKYSHAWWTRAVKVVDGSTGGRGVRVEAGVGKGMQVVAAAAGSELHLITVSHEGYQNFFNEDIKRLCNRQKLNLLISHYWMTKVYPFKGEAYFIEKLHFIIFLKWHTNK